MDWRPVPRNLCLPPVKRQKLSHEDSKEDIQKQRQRLPIHAVKRKLTQELKNNQTSIVIGETACGKTTQIPQYLHEAGLSQAGVIAVTQPRRVAAISIATRVAKEVGNSELGCIVGYTVRFDDLSTHATKIKYMTDGMLLREAIGDPLLKRYSTVILDEAHERTIHTDVLFGIVKNAQQRRQSEHLQPLKIIVMSATMDVDHFSQYFNKAPVIYLEGRQHPVEVLYAAEEQTDYLFAALVTVFQIHKTAPPQHDILVFLTGRDEIDAVVHTIKDIAKGLPSSMPRLLVWPLYASLPSHQQMRIFQPTPPGYRKVIVSTNVAETSVTISGIKYVVDTGMVKAKTYAPGSGLDLLKVQRVSKAQAWQRTGRAGRESRGMCYRLYTQSEYKQLPDNPVPEIKRCNLAHVVLQLLALGFKNVEKFDFLDKPDSHTLQVAMEELQVLGAAIREDGQLSLTVIGQRMSTFPLDPKLSKVIIASRDLGCTEEVITLVAVLSCDTILVTPQVKREEALAIRRKFVSSDGDLMTYLNVYKAFRSVLEPNQKKWCFENFLNFRNLQMAHKIRQQLKDLCIRANIALRSCGQDLATVRSCFAQGMFMNAAELQREGQYVTLGTTKHKVSIHPSSCLFMCKPGYVIYNELVQTTKCYMRDLVVINPEWLHDAAPDYFRQIRGVHH